MHNRKGKGRDKAPFVFFLILNIISIFPVAWGLNNVGQVCLLSVFGYVLNIQIFFFFPHFIWYINFIVSIEYLK